MSTWYNLNLLCNNDRVLVGNFMCLTKIIGNNQAFHSIHLCIKLYHVNPLVAYKFGWSSRVGVYSSNQCFPSSGQSSCVPCGRKVRPKMDWILLYPYLLPYFFSMKTNMYINIKQIQKLLSLFVLNRYGYVSNIRYIFICSKWIRVWIGY